GAPGDLALFPVHGQKLIAHGANVETIADDGRSGARLAIEVHGREFRALGRVDDVQLAIAAGHERLAFDHGRRAVDRSLRLELPPLLAVLVQAVKRLVPGAEQHELAREIRPGNDLRARLEGPALGALGRVHAMEDAVRVADVHRSVAYARRGFEGAAFVLPLEGAVGQAESVKMLVRRADVDHAL